jgi:hypothetical protein
VGERARSVVLAFLLVAAVSGSLWLRATGSPPKGTVFAGTFFYVDDFYNYLSYVEQAERGAILLRNKLADPAHPPSLLNLEWLGVGRLSALLGGRPLLAYRLFGLAVLALMAWAVDSWLVRAGLPRERRLPALLLVFTGGGAGGVLLALGLVPGPRALDVRAGIFPFVEAVANPHFVAGTALLLAALLAFASGRGARGALLGSILGLIRPYDAALLAAVEGLAVLSEAPPRQWLRRLLPVAGLLPVLAYNAWVFLAGPGFSVFSSPRYAAEAPALRDLGLALGPALLLAALAARTASGSDERAAAHRRRLWLWVAVALLVVVGRPVSFSLQFIVGLGAPLLVLAAVGLGRLRRGALEAAVLVLSPSALVVTALCLRPAPGRFVPADVWGVVRELRSACRPGDLVLAPPEVGLLLGGLTPCWPYVSHPAAPDHAPRAEAVRAFYGAAPAQRAALLDASCIAHVVGPADPPEGWLGERTPFGRRSAALPGLSVWSREPGAACAGER